MGCGILTPWNVGSAVVQSSVVSAQFPPHWMRTAGSCISTMFIVCLLASAMDRQQRASLQSPIVFADANFDSNASNTIKQEMWEKWVFISALAGITCLMRAPIGDIVAGGGAEIATSLLDECATIARGQGFPPRQPAMQRFRATVTMAGSPFAASMLRDIERGARTEAEHIFGDLLRQDRDPSKYPILRIAYAHLLTYEAQRARAHTE